MAIAEREPHTAPTPPYFPQAKTWEPYQQTLAERWYVMPMQSSFSSQSAWGVGGGLASGSCRCGGEGARGWWPGTAPREKGLRPGFVGRVVDGKVERETQMLPTLPTIRIPLRWAVPLLAAHPASPRLSEHLRAALNQAEAVP